MNSEYCQDALKLVVNPNILVNLVSRRVRQLAGSGGERSRPLISETATMGAADIALRELLEDKMGWEMLEPIVPPAKPTRRRKKKKTE